MRHASFSSIAVSLLSLTVGCANKEGEPLVEVYTPVYQLGVCPTESCDLAVQFLAVDLADCFGWDPETYPGTGWPPSAPVELNLDWCNPDIHTPYCVLELGPGVVASAPTGDPRCPTCVPDAEWNDEFCCEVPQPGGENWADFVSVEFAQGVQSCIAEEDVHPALNSCQPLAAVLREQCDPVDQLFGVAPGANYVLFVDPEDSYLDISCPQGTETFALGGGGSAATGPARFMTGLVWLEDGALGTHDLTNWYWSLDVPIQISQSGGSFTVDADGDPLFVGSGFDDEVGWTVKAIIAEDATGTFSGNTWHLDFEQTVLEWTVEVHLEGALEAAP